MANYFKAGANLLGSVFKKVKGTTYKSVTQTPAGTYKVKTRVTSSGTKTKNTFTPANTGNSLTPKTTKTSGIGKFALGAGAGGLGMSLLNMRSTASTDPEPTPTPTPTPDPEPQYILDPYSGGAGGQGGGGTAYLSGDEYGESGSIIEEALATLKEYSPWLIGLAVLAVVILLVKKKNNHKKRGGNRV